MPALSVRGTLAEELREHQVQIDTKDPTRVRRLWGWSEGRPLAQTG
jgi:hypothetical protein